MASKGDYYDILGLDKSASTTEIKSAYKKKALEWHPDRHKDNKEEAEKRFKEINEAYQILSDSSKKSAYDQHGHAAFAPGGAGGANPFAGAAGGQQGPFRYTYTNTGGQGSPFTGFDFGDPFDIFESFFGGGGFRQAKQIPRYSIKIDFMEAINGVTKEVNMDGKKKKIKIPAGVNEGTRINFGSFTLSIDVTPHDVFERDGDDIYVKMTIPYSLAVLGGEIKAPTLEGKEVKLKVRPATSSGSMIRLKGKGAPNPHHRGKGDQYIRLNILVPEKPTKKQKNIIEEMKKEEL
ncbi:DnaJ domain-containing protein [Candidatus Microgenomates bacterium]|nr:DnaJ domain-containing protein [Candidatus Microgenomates bacterium]